MDGEQDVDLPSAIIVAHPDDETLWAGGYILSHPEQKWVIVTLCRRTDPDRAPKFKRVLQRYHATGEMGDLDDGPDQHPLPNASVAQEILRLLPDQDYALLLTHHPQGEYTRHLRHEETSQNVTRLWKEGIIRSKQLWWFAYEDQQGPALPRVQAKADLLYPLPDPIWKEKYRLITQEYGFSEDSWEARTTPRVEGFWCFPDLLSYQNWVTARRLRE